MGNSVGETTLDVACTNGLKALVIAISDELRQKVGTPFKTEFVSTKKLVEQIEAGARPDLAIASDEAIDALIADRRLAAPRIDVAKSVVGVAVRKGTPHPDISTVDAFFRALKDAPSISRSRLGMSGQHLAALIERFGFAAELTPKIKVYDAYAAQACADGETDLAVQQISELLPVAGLEIVGPLPDAIQKITMFSAGVAAHTAQRKAAEAFIGFLKSKEVAPRVRAAGLDPL